MACQKIRTVPGADFLWLILQHVLPKGFRRARDYGFLHGNARKRLRLVQLLLHIKIPLIEEPRRPAFICPVCGAEMKIAIRKAHGILPSQEAYSQAFP
ncbi:MAG: transposase [Candidatus Riflebacteria bacterium]|nr:transposase [Candidatus Riflebacteria bacterium]